MKETDREKNIRKRVLHTLKHESKAVSELEKTISAVFFNAISAIERRSGKIIVTGVGKSGFVGMKTAATLTSLGHSSFFLNPTDAMHGDVGMVDDGDVIIALSFSGGTQELLKVLRHSQNTFDIALISITGDKESGLAKISDFVLPIYIEGEGCPLGRAPMASTTSSLVVGDLIASALTSPDTFSDEHFAKYHPAGTLGLTLRKVGEVIKKNIKVPFVTKKQTFEEALREITNGSLGAVAVVDENNALEGIITDGDVRRIVLQNGYDKEESAATFMTMKPKQVSREDSLKTALEIMEEHKITHLFVTDQNGGLNGIIHIHDILEDVV